MTTVATIAMCAISILLLIATYMLAGVRRAHEASLISLIEIREMLTADLQQLEARIKALEER